MVLQLSETQKALNKVFLKFKANRVALERFKTKRTPFSNCSNENESERFSKKRTQDFILKSSYDPNYSLDNLSCNFSMTSIAETLIGKKIEAKTPDFLFVRIAKTKNN